MHRACLAGNTTQSYAVCAIRAIPAASDGVTEELCMDWGVSKSGLAAGGALLDLSGVLG